MLAVSASLANDTNIRDTMRSCTNKDLDEIKYVKVHFWHSADISALPHPGIIKLCFDIPYQLLLILFKA